MTAQELITDIAAICAPSQLTTPNDRLLHMLAVTLANLKISPADVDVCLDWIRTGSFNSRDHECAECPHNDSDGTICTEPKCPRKSKQGDKDEADR